MPSTVTTLSWRIVSPDAVEVVTAAVTEGAGMAAPTVTCEGSPTVTFADQVPCGSVVPNTEALQV